ncbi:50S ribosomal protein L13 [Candidatus Saccharibacteria bacterium]|nr:50S ribosomal protein L13 [Candidatus Saccharibacteria bacterium]HOR23341.1 50S ribosomal protein L13 [Candidatus Saccharibacteria bacterium]
MKTFSAKPSDVVREWYIIDASEKPLGRLSTQIARLLMGKHKPLYTAHIDCGDSVVVINSDKMIVTGNKLQSKKYYRHSHYPGGLKSATLEEMMAKDSTEIIKLAVKGMLPKNKLLKERLKRLRVFKDAVHNHEAQKPKKVSFE